MQQGCGRVVVAALLTVVLSGCSLFGSRTQVITVSTDPAGADVMINGERAGRSPLKYRVSRSEDLLIEVRKEGYSMEFRNANRTLSPLGIVDIVGGSILLLPFVGLVSSAAWEFEPSAYGIVLEPKSTGNGL